MSAIFSTEEAEQEIIGSLMLRPENWQHVATELHREDFYFPVHGRIFDHMRQIFDTGRTPSPALLAPLFENDPDLDRVGGREYIAELMANAHGVRPQDCAALIRVVSQRRRLLACLDEMKARAEDMEEQILPLAAEIVSEVEKISAGTGHSVAQSQVISDIFERLKAQKQPCSTGLARIDIAMAGGLYPGFTYAFAAKAKAGKTTLAHSISYNLNAGGVKHAYIALEMGQQEIVMRQIARHGGFNSLKFLEDRSTAFLEKAANVALTLPDNCVYADLPTGNFTELKAVLAQAVIRDRIKGFILDYWQLVQGQEQGQTNEAHLAAVAQWIAGFCRQHGIWSIVICQLNKDDNAFGSAGINRACDQFYKLYRGTAEGCDDQAWLDLEHSRYTFSGPVGSEMLPSLRHNTRIGPYMEDFT